MYVGNTPADKYISMAVQHFTTSATTSYTLDHAVTNENEIRLVINNVVQQPGSSYAYTASGTALTLSAATTSSDTMYCVFLGKAVQTVTPAASSVTNNMLAGSIANSKLTNSSITLNGSAVSLGSSATTAYESQLFHLQHIEASSVDAGGNSAASNNQRTLNSTVVNQISGASVSSNDVTLPAGTYIIDGYAGGFRLGRHFLRWYNSTDASYIINGQSMWADQNNEVFNVATISGRFTISAQKTFALMHYSQSSFSQGNALGIASNVTTNHYVNLRIWKVA